MNQNAHMQRVGATVLTDTSNVRIKPWYEYYSKNGTPHDNARLFYIKGIRKLLRAQGFTEEKVRLYSEIPTIESEWDPLAINKYSGAAGLWQITPSTYVLFGGHLRDIHDPYKSSIVAVRLLKYLDSTFQGNKVLVLFAYNAGAPRVVAALKRINTSDPWQVKFKNETYSFAPKIYGATLARLNKLWNTKSTYNQKRLGIENR